MLPASVAHVDRQQQATVQTFTSASRLPRLNSAGMTDLGWPALRRLAYGVHALSLGYSGTARPALPMLIPMRSEENRGS